MQFLARAARERPVTALVYPNQHRLYSGDCTILSDSGSPLTNQLFALPPGSELARTLASIGIDFILVTDGARS